jgi:hypothetical protein
MGHIKDWKPATVRGKRSWDDQEFFKSLSDQFAARSRYRPSRSWPLKKMLRRYADQAPGYDARSEELNLLPRAEPTPKKV